MNSHLGQDPPTLIQPYALLKYWQASFHALRALWIQRVTAAMSLALVIGLITLIANGSANAFLKALLGVLGIVGLSAATIQASLKTTAQGLLSRLRQDAYTDPSQSQSPRRPTSPAPANPARSSSRKSESGP